MLTPIAQESIGDFVRNIRGSAKRVRELMSVVETYEDSAAMYAISELLDNLADAVNELVEVCSAEAEA